MAPYRSIDDWSYSEDGKIVAVTIAITDDEAYPSGWRYALHYGTTDGDTILRFDNAHEETKGHEKHVGETVETIDFPGMLPLYERFLERVRSDLEDLPRRGGRCHHEEGIYVKTQNHGRPHRRTDRADARPTRSS